MAISLASLTRVKKLKPPRLLVYGVEGIGKSSLGASAPNPVFIRTEDGAPEGAVCFPVATSFGEVIEALGALYTEDHDRRTVVVDSVDWLERLVWAETCRRNKWNSIEDPGYGKGYNATLAVWNEFLDGINALRDHKDMIVVLIAHSEVKRFENPETDPYDRYQIKLHKAAAALLQEHCDGIFFLNYQVSTTKSDVGFGQKKTRAVGGSGRVLFSSARPAFIAKTRYEMPEQIALPKDSPFGAIAGYLPLPDDLRPAAA